MNAEFQGEWFKVNAEFLSHQESPRNFPTEQDPFLKGPPDQNPSIQKKLELQLTFGKVWVGYGPTINFWMDAFFPFQGIGLGDIV